MTGMLCACGCKQSVTPPRQFRRGHNARLRHELHYKVEDRGHETACWIWTAALNRKGYGRCQRNGSHIGAHKASYERFIGPVPAGMVLDHLCHVPACINPAHLEVVSNAENVRRGKSTRLTADDVRAIRASDEHARDLARRFGVHRNHIYTLRRGERWTDLEAAA